MDGMYFRQGVLFPAPMPIDHGQHRMYALDLDARLTVFVG